MRFIWFGPFERWLYSLSNNIRNFYCYPHRFFSTQILNCAYHPSIVHSIIKSVCQLWAKRFSDVSVQVFLFYFHPISRTIATHFINKNSNSPEKKRKKIIIRHKNAIQFHKYFFLVSFSHYSKSQFYVHLCILFLFFACPIDQQQKLRA